MAIAIVARAVFPNGFSLRQFTSVMIAGRNRSVARANNGSETVPVQDRQRSRSGSNRQWAHKRAQQCAVDTQLFTGNGKIHCSLHGRRLHRCRTPSSLLSHHQSNNVHIQHRYPGITPIVTSQWSKVLTSVLASLQGHNSAGT